MYGWWALGFSVVSILLYFAGLMCTHLAAFRCAANMRKRATEHLMHTGLGYFDTHASGALRRVVNGCAAETEGMRAHKLPDTAGSVAMIVGMLVLFFVFDWRLGLACLVPVAILLPPGDSDFGAFLTNFAFYAIFSAVIPTAMTRVMFMSDALQSATDAVNRVEEVLTAPTIKAPVAPKEPVDNSIAFEDVSFTYEGANEPALSHVSFSVPAGSTVALVGPSGGGKTTAASLVPRFWDACVGRVLMGGADVRSMEPRRLMEHVAQTPHAEDVLLRLPWLRHARSEPGTAGEARKTFAAQNSGPTGFSLASLPSARTCAASGSQGRPKGPATNKRRSS